MPFRQKFHDEPSPVPAVFTTLISLENILNSTHILLHPKNNHSFLSILPLKISSSVVKLPPMF